MKLSIVICTYNRAFIVTECIDSLLHQSASTELYEIIIVNNNSTDATPQIAESYARKYDHIRTVTETEQGLSHARNRGVVEAKGEWVAYLDDDAKAAPNWIERILYIVDHYPFDCFGGIYLPWYRDGKPRWYKDEYGSNTHIYDKTGILPQNCYFSGGNSVFRKAMLQAADGFSGKLGMKGKKIFYGEENLMQLNLRQLGHTIGFDPELIIYHYVPFYKQSVFWFYKSAYQSGAAGWITYKKRVSPRLLFVNLAAIFLFPLLYAPKNFLKLFQNEYYFQNFMIDTFRRSASTLGRFVEGVKISVRGLRKEAAQ